MCTAIAHTWTTVGYDGPSLVHSCDCGRYTYEEWQIAIAAISTKQRSLDVWEWDEDGHFWFNRQTCEDLTPNELMIRYLQLQVELETMRQDLQACRTASWGRAKGPTDLTWEEEQGK